MRWVGWPNNSNKDFYKCHPDTEACDGSLVTPCYRREGINGPPSSSTWGPADALTRLQQGPIVGYCIRMLFLKVPVSIS